MKILRQRFGGAAAVLAVIISVFSIIPGSAHAVFISTPNSGTLSVNGTVSTIVTSSSTVYIGGSFTYIGTNIGYSLPVNTSNGSVSTTGYPQTNGAVSTVISDGSGGWYLGGSFTQIGGITRNRIARVLSNGTVDLNFDPNANNTVSALALSSDGSTLYAGGGFTTVGGVTYNGLAAINTSNGTASTTFNPNVDVSNNGVSALALSSNGSTLYAGGTFTTVGGVTYNGLAAINTSNGTASTTFNPNVDVSNNGVSALALSSDGSTLYAGGGFTTVGGVTYNGLAAINTSNGTASTTFNPNVDVSNNGVSALALSSNGSTLYAGGGFTTVGGVTYNGLAAINTSNGTASTTFNPNVDVSNNGVSALALSSNGSTLYAGGGFTTVGGVTYNGLAAINTSNGTASTTFNPNMSGTVFALALSSDGSTLYAGGGSTILINGSSRSNLAALDSTGKILSSFNPNVTGGLVSALALSSNGSTLYAGGTFTTVGGVTYNRLAAINTSNGTASTTFNPNMSGTVFALALSSDGSTLYAGGYFSTVGGVTYNHLAAINTSNGTASTTFNPNANSTVSALALSSNGSTLYAGGTFTTVGGVTYNRLAAINTSNGTASTTFNPNMSGTVFALALSSDGSTLYAGGGFTTVGGVTYNNLAAVSTANGTASTTFNPNMSSTVFALALSPDGSTLYAGGYFSTVGGVTYNHLAAINTSNGTASTTFNPNANSTVSALALSSNGSTLYAGGTFTTVGTSLFSNLALFTSVNPPTVTTTAASSISTSTATLNGAVTSTGNASITQSGFAYGTDPTLTTGVSTSTLGSQTGAAAFTQNVSGLSLNTAYYVRAYAVNVSGTTFGSTLPFLTLPLPPVLSSVSITSTGATTLSAQGTIASVNGVNASIRGIAYGSTSSYTQSVAENGSFTAAPFTESLANLACNSTYHLAAFATNTGGTAYGPDYTATTAACPVTAAPVVYASVSGGSASASELASLLAPGPAATAYLASRGMSPSAVTTAAPATFSRDLTLGSTGSDVKALQQYLNAHGYPVAATGAGSPGHETTLFGLLTKAALSRFQRAHGITPAAGYFGPVTRGVAGK